MQNEDVGESPQAHLHHALLKLLTVGTLPRIIRSKLEAAKSRFQCLLKQYKTSICMYFMALTEICVCTCWLVTAAGAITKIYTLMAEVTVDPQRFLQIPLTHREMEHGLFKRKIHLFFRSLQVYIFILTAAEGTESSLMSQRRAQELRVPLVSEERPSR